MSIPFNAHQTLTRRRILQGAVAVAASSMLPKGHSQQPLGTQPAPSGTIVQGSVTVGATAPGSMGSGFGSLAYEKIAMNCSGGSSNGYRRLCDAGNTDAVGLFKTLAPNGGTIRIGGNSADHCVWHPTGAGQTSYQIAPADVDALAGFLQATGWKCLYTINLAGSSPVWLFRTNTTLAAEEAAYVANTLGIYNPVTNPNGLLLALGIGNEPDLYGHLGGPYGWRTMAAAMPLVLNAWIAYLNAVVAAVPGLPIVAPSFSGEAVDLTPTNWLGEFASLEAGNFSLLDYHYYPWGPGTSAASLLNSDTYLTGTVLPALSAAAGAGVPFAITESASVGGAGQDGVSNAYAGALWTIDFLFNCAQGGASYACFESGNTGNYYSPIQDTSGQILNPPLPDYYGIQLVNMAGEGTLCQTSVSSSGLNVTAYAINNTGGGLSLMIVNKDLNNNNLQVSIQLPQSFNSGTLIEMTQLSPGATAPSLTATSGVTIQGSDVSVSGAFTPAAPYQIQLNGSQASCYAPALSAVLLKFS